MDETSQPGPAPADRTDAKSSRRSRWIANLKRLRGPIVALAAVGTVVGGLSGYWSGWRALRSGMGDGAAAAPAKVDGPVAPFSAADRRMTFAVLPFDAPSGDAVAQRLARDAYERTHAMQEANVLWARVVPRALVEQQTARPQTASALGAALDVHFLFRGSVARDDTGYTLALTVVDAATEQTLHQRMLKVGTPEGDLALDAKALRLTGGQLTFAALKKEVARAQAKPDAQLDVRDLTFRAYVDWVTSDNTDPAAAHAAVMKNLNRSLALAPDDLLTLRIVAEVNLCECLRAWANDNRPMEEIGLAALDRYLAQRPDEPRMLKLRLLQFHKHGRFQEALLLNERLRTLDPGDRELLRIRVALLRVMGELDRALQLVPQMLGSEPDVAAHSAAAAVYFAAGDDDRAALHAREALVGMQRRERADRDDGNAALVLVAAEARAGRLDLARKALADFHAVLPGLRTVEQIQGWLNPRWAVPGGEAFWQALRQAGVQG